MLLAAVAWSLFSTAANLNSLSLTVATTLLCTKSSAVGMGTRQEHVVGITTRGVFRALRWHTGAPLRTKANKLMTSMCAVHSMRWAIMHKPGWLREGYGRMYLFRISLKSPPSYATKN
ncbi:hypothetical protein EJ02DRAFT_107674 [Clathrospora elynae]|uniref:Secreted protein n=1 Tax=Clathrospora elynae TaxID=706981 RepID=A0A6A5S785_9PLEO|nr:hypothetical protein EJ02DRAFT_107674 [Clathrospora elynae]